MADIFNTNQVYFQYVRRICTKRKPLDCPQLISKTKRRFDLDLDTTKKILKGFLDSNLILVKNKEVSVDIMANSTRRMILAQITSYPGCYLNYLKNKLNLGTNQLIWHLSVLSEFKYIKIVEVGKIKAFGLIDTPKIDIILGCFMLKDPIRKLFAVLIENPEGKSQAELSEIMFLPRTTITYWLKHLSKMNIIENKRETRPKLYYLNEKYIKNAKSRLIRYNAL